MKKRLLFVIDSLALGGAEKSLVTLLNLLDYNRFEVDLQLFGYGGAFSQFLPEGVRLLSPLAYTRFLAKPTTNQLLHPRMLAARVRYSLALREKGLAHADRARRYWDCVSHCIPCTDKSYDVAIAYAQGVPTFYVVDKARAKRKVAWVNVDYRLSATNQDFQRRFYGMVDDIVLVSASARTVFGSVYPEFAAKMQIIHDINDADMINRLSELPAEQEIDHSLPVIMTTGRLNYPQKGYDLALQAALLLRQRGEMFRWYAVGEGPMRADMETCIRENHLEKVFVLLGATPNPYSYMRQCDIYVQPSRHEGFGLTIAEARILNRPVVCTAFDGCDVQIADGVNGLVVDINAEAIANGIQRLLHDKQLYNSIADNLQHEKKGNTEELEMFYRLVL